MTVHSRYQLVLLAALVAGSNAAVGCTARGSTVADAGAPPVAIVEHEGDDGRIRVEHPDRVPLATASAHEAAPELIVTGVVNADVSRAVPVVSLASGRVVDLRARLGDQVRKGQLLMRIQSAEVAAASAEYRKAVADRALAERQLDRASALFDRGALARKELEIAEDAAAKARVDVENAIEKLRVMGVDAGRPASPIVDVLAPVSGVITEQNVTNAAGVKSLDNTPNLFTISDLSSVWIVCDLAENDLQAVQLGDMAEIRPAAFPDRRLEGRIDNVGAILDPAIRTAKVRIEAANPGFLRIGMFVTATLHGRTAETRAVVPAAAVLHLHDRDWVYAQVGIGEFERREVIGGAMLAGGLQELRKGLRPGERVVANALTLQSGGEQ